MFDNLAYLIPGEFPNYRLPQLFRGISINKELFILFSKDFKVLWQIKNFVIFFSLFFKFSFQKLRRIVHFQPN